MCIRDRSNCRIVSVAFINAPTYLVIEIEKHIFVMLSKNHLAIFFFYNKVSEMCIRDRLNPIADQSGWHEYSRKWFVKALFDTSPIGQITSSPDWTFEPPDYINPDCKRNYYPNSGYQKIQGKGIVQGRLIGLSLIHI